MTPRQFSDLPKQIKDQLVSEATTRAIASINDRLTVFGNALRLLPRAITRLVTGALPPHQFIATLQEEIALDYPAAQSAAREVLDKILKPVLLPLKEIGIDAALIIDGPASTKSRVRAPSTPERAGAPPMSQKRKAPQK